ncbi:carbohydrate-binding module family 50 protein [Saccharata proteae CBS 121410]|uniref:Carbohydrate-binding module family 50 protein n=1 Tax=Saccharata proteae CBS 121410 TaxID=1314787 RepID=A0A9P4M0B3_9PEZI|nr:carbohydrate-binding module family 50 protein [Saccharata proteae CBS 121410]
MNPTNASQQSSRNHLTPASSLRPRNKRLISGFDDDGAGSSPNGTDSRAASPIPHLPRAYSSQGLTKPQSTGNSKGERDRSESGTQDTLGQLSGLWSTSWTSLQGLASNVLGSDPTANSTDPPRRRRPLEATHGRKSSTSAPPAQWGPSARTESRIGAGSKEERETMVRAMKRKDLMSGNCDTYPDTLGKFKRRNSDDRVSSSAPPTEHDDRDALVYIHRVTPNDTLAGISIKFNCQQAAIRKANRMWPNDSVQTRRHLVLPVDACAVKGRPIPEPGSENQELKALDEEEDLLGTTPVAEHPPMHTPSSSLPTNGWHHPDFSKPPPASETSSHAEEPPWKHDSWVTFPHAMDPVEIARLPRRDLGFFPPARRKSLTYSDQPTQPTTPSASLDLIRSDTSTSKSSASTMTSPPRGAPRRSRAPSISQSFALNGPGGVGTFNRNVRKPGPAQDGLNKIFGQHLPNLAPPPGKDYFGTWNPAALESQGPSGTNTPVGVGGVGGSSAGAGFDFEQVGGAIEGWVRKVAARAQTIIPPANPLTPGRQAQPKNAVVSGVGLNAAVGGDMSDLIELTDAFEIGDEEEEEGRGRQQGSSGAGTGRGVSGTASRRRNEGGSVKGAKGD